MDGRCLFYTFAGIVLCLVGIFATLLIVLWDQRVWVAWGFIGLILLTVLVFVAWQINEMVLRHKLYHHNTETPLDADGYPVYMPEGAQYYRSPVGQPRD